MPDNGMPRAVAREAFGLFVRLAALWILWDCGITVFTLMGPLSNPPLMVGAVLGVLVGIWMLLRADFLCRLTYGRTAPDRSVR